MLCDNSTISDGLYDGVNSSSAHDNSAVFSDALSVHGDNEFRNNSAINSIQKAQNDQPNECLKSVN